MGMVSRSTAFRFGVLGVFPICLFFLFAACSRQPAPGGIVPTSAGGEPSELPPAAAVTIPSTNTAVPPKSRSHPTEPPVTMTEALSPPAASPTMSAAPSVTPTETSTAASLPPVPTMTPAPVPVPIGSLVNSDSPGPYLISGTVVDTASFSQGFKLTVDDGTGRIILLMWHDLYDDCWDAPYLNIGSRLTVKGDISWYEGKLQIEPGFGGDVKLLSAGDWSPPHYPIGSLGEVVGQRALVVGGIVRVEASGGGVNFYVADESGEIAAYIWDNVLERIPGSAALGVPGTRVRVIGMVQLYRDNLEIVPSLPYDVEIVP